MKLVREYINEKFSEDSDPIHDMGIGLMHEKWAAMAEIEGRLSSDKFNKKYNIHTYFDAAFVIYKILKNAGLRMLPQIAFDDEMHNYRYKERAFVANLLKKHFLMNVNPTLHPTNESFTIDSDPVSDMGIGLKFAKIKNGDIVKSIKGIERDDTNTIVFSENKDFHAGTRFIEDLCAVVAEHLFEDNKLYLKLIRVSNIDSARGIKRMIAAEGISNQYIYTYGRGTLSDWEEFFKIIY